MVAAWSLNGFNAQVRTNTKQVEAFYLTRGAVGVTEDGDSARQDDEAAIVLDQVSQGRSTQVDVFGDA